MPKGSSDRPKAGSTRRHLSTNPSEFDELIRKIQDLDIDAVLLLRRDGKYMRLVGTHLISRSR